MAQDIGAAFRRLHQRGNPFVLANAWDAGSARMLVALGAKAVATSSAAHAFTLGLPDGGTITRYEALSHAQSIVAAVSVPVQGDFEDGFGPDPDTCAETVRLAARIGLAGICIEDTALPSQDPYEASLAIERIRAAASAARALPHDFVLTARADGLLTGGYDLTACLARLKGFAAAGADCLYAPLPADMDQIAQICAATSLPVNVLIAGWTTAKSLSDFAGLGVARLSLGSSLARVTHRAIHDAAQQMFGSGRFDLLAQGMSGSAVDRLLRGD